MPPYLLGHDQKASPSLLFVSSESLIIRIRLYMHVFFMYILYLACVFAHGHSNLVAWMYNVVLICCCPVSYCELGASTSLNRISV